ncbi:MAG: antibiotic biosynthesis monooxygenase [Sedimenticola sp.]|nr:antibiotic biosynthesis monooxygenase [Sedimenticola sp.]
MFIVTVVFEVKLENLDAFMSAMMIQADNSLLLESDCHQFDVCQDTDDPNHIFLYEVYTDELSFQVHLASDHFAEFSARTNDWVISKVVDTWERL